MSDQNWGSSAALLGISAGTVLLVQEHLKALQEKENRLQDVREEYFESLRALEGQSGDQFLKEEAFMRGIVYAGLMRDAGREHEFDEENVTADIQRAIRLGQTVSRQENPGALERLHELATLRDAGLISEEEYQKKRIEIIASI